MRPLSWCERSVIPFGKQSQLLLSMMSDWLYRWKWCKSATRKVSDEAVQREQEYATSDGTDYDDDD